MHRAYGFITHEDEVFSGRSRSPLGRPVGLPLSNAVTPECMPTLRIVRESSLCDLATFSA